MSSVPAVNPPGSQTLGAQTTEARNDSVSWQRHLAEAIRNPTDLLKKLGISAPEEPLTSLSPAFPVLVPLSFLQRMVPGDLKDPLLLQVLATPQETGSVDGFVADPVDDHAARTAPGLLQKYEGRALLVTNGACAVHCRYCFRREYPYQNEPRQMDDWQPALDHIAADCSITEVILSGGDPLMLNDDRLSTLFSAIDAIPHVERLRIHTRMPIVLPARITSAFLALAASLRCQPIVVVHANHGNEIAADCEDALKALTRQGFPVLNQAVLLKDVNDSVESLELLSRRLINIGVMPYYLHQLDRVTGAAHFEVPHEHGLRLIKQLASRLPGYAVPKYVQEIPGASGKTLLR